MLPGKYFTIIFFNAEKKAYKYRNIKNDSKTLQRFTTFALTKGAVEMNLYDKVTKNFSHKIFLKGQKD